MYLTVALVRTLSFLVPQSALKCLGCPRSYPGSQLRAATLQSLWQQRSVYFQMRPQCARSSIQAQAACCGVMSQGQLEPDVRGCAWPVTAPARRPCGQLCGERGVSAHPYSAASEGSALTLAPVRLEDSTKGLGMDGTGPPAWFSCRLQNQAVLPH